VAALGLVACNPEIAAPSAPSAAPITLEEITAAQESWGQALGAIGQASPQGDDPRAVATEAISRLYAYADGPVLFKPTLTHGAQTFRTTAAGALAYFAGSDPEFPGDTGFALKPWTAVRFQTGAFRLRAYPDHSRGPRDESHRPRARGGATAPIGTRYARQRQPRQRAGAAITLWAGAKKPPRHVARRSRIYFIEAPSSRLAERLFDLQRGSRE
jgi:hypothetical protein